MSFICSVCQDPLTTNPDDDGLDQVGAAGGGAPQQVDMIVTKCGHLYHQVCITRWFNSQTNPRQECPNCQQPVGNNGFQRVFPAGDEATGREVTAARNKAQAKAQELETLRLEREELRTILAERENALKEESLAHDALKLEHAVTLSELDQANDQLKKEAQRVRELVTNCDEFAQMYGEMVDHEANQGLLLETTKTDLAALKEEFAQLVNAKLKCSDTIDQLQAENDQLKEKLKDLSEASKAQQKTTRTPDKDEETIEARILAYKRCQESLKTAQAFIQELWLSDSSVLNGTGIVKEEPEEETDADESNLAIKNEPEDYEANSTFDCNSANDSSSDLSAADSDVHDGGGEALPIAPAIVASPPPPVKA